LLAHAIGRRLAECRPLVRLDRMDPAASFAGAPLGGCSAVVAASDAWDSSHHAALRKACAERALPWLPVRTELGTVVIGPFEQTGTPGCAECAELRRRLARRYPRGHDAVWSQHGTALRGHPSALLTHVAADLVAALVHGEVEAPDAARTRCALLYVDLRTLRITRHPFVADPHCPVCGVLPADDPSSACLGLQPRPKPGPHIYRIRALADELPALRRTFVDAETGIVRALHRNSHNGVVVAAAALGLRDGGVEYGHGRTRSYRASELTALLEALERHGGLRPGGKRTHLQASYGEVADRAVDPRTLGVHPASSYRRPDFPFEPFDEDRPYRWVWAYSFARRAPILVPESYAFYGVARGIVYEVSNGCALGGCLEEAVLFGLLEVAERDAFLLTWYGRLPVPRIDPGTARDRTIPMLVAAIKADTGYDVMIFDTTVEQLVPCAWVMAVNPLDDERPKVVCGAGAHLDLERACGNALSELGPILAGLIQSYPGERDRVRQMAADPSLVTEMADHSLLYGDPGVFDRLGFLTGSTELRSFADRARPAAFGNPDLRTDLLELTGRYLDCGLDVLVVDQTGPEHRAGGLACVKVIVPGTLPMTFGHLCRRIDGLPRLYEVPRLLGYRDEVLAPDDVNPHPHPFP
jgi:ribosomal protein S12 methylthiotransferase accessory factor